MSFKSKISCALLITACLIQAGCGNHHDVKFDTPSQNREMSGGDLDNEAPMTALGFQDIYENIIEQNCKTCHSKYANYDNVKGEEAEKILEQVLTNQMPQFSPGLSQNLKDMLEEWVAAGAPEFGSL